MPHTSSARRPHTLPCVAGALTLCTAAILLSVGAAHAQSGAPPLIYTACGSGFLSQCGEQVISHDCRGSWSVDFGWITRSFGVKYEAASCNSTTTKTLYRNIDQQSRYDGVCVANPIATRDATRTRKDTC